MPVTKIYLVRHGESEANRDNTFLGHANQSLTARGHSQAEKTAAFLESVPIDAIYTSDLDRAYETALHIAERKGLPVTKCEGLREIRAGEWEEMRFDEIERRYPDAYRTWMEDIGNARCVGGESVAELQSRFAREVERIARANEGKCILIVSHAMAIRSLKAAWDGLPLSEMKNVPWASNASVSAGEFRDGIFRMTDYSIDHFMGSIGTVLADNI